jgi:hypothetical protein
MFVGNFSETHYNKNHPLVLKDVDVTAFEIVLQFLYTQCIPEITASTVEELLIASDYFEIPEIENACVSFIEKNLSTIKNVLEIFLFAHTSNKDTLVTILSQYIVDHLHIVSWSDTFLEISFDVFLELFVLRQCYLSDIERLIIDEDSALDAIIRWVLHSSPQEEQKRRQHFEELIGMIDLDRISSGYAEYCLKQYNFNIRSALAPQLKNISSSEDCATYFRFYAAGATENIPTLHLYFYNNFYRNLKIVSANKHKPDWFVSCQKNYDAYFDYLAESVTLSCPDRLYCLKVSRIGIPKEQRFCTYSSINASLTDTVRLSTLPLDMISFNLASLPDENRVYLYNVFADKNSVIDEGRAVSLGFDSEEICRGIYCYNCELDKWFPVPKMKSRMRGACMTATHNMVYLIGGESYDREYSRGEIGYAQAYDYRVSDWIKIPNTHKLYNCTVRSCSSIDGKIYVSDGYSIEVFDPVAGKWDLIIDAGTTVEGYGQYFYIHQMKFYENLLWLNGMNIINRSLTSPRTKWGLAVYDTISQAWSTSKSLNIKNCLEKSNGTTDASQGLSSHAIKDVVVFKPASNYI